MCHPVGEIDKEEAMNVSGGHRLMGKLCIFQLCCKPKMAVKKFLNKN